MKKSAHSKGGGFGAKGGTTHMSGKNGVGPQEPGQSTSGGQKNGSAKVASGGKTGVMGKQRGAAPATPGGVSPGGRGGDNKWGVHGGSGHMAGKGSAENARAK